MCHTVYGHFGQVISWQIEQLSALIVQLCEAYYDRQSADNASIADLLGVQIERGTAHIDI